MIDDDRLTTPERCLRNALKFLMRSIFIAGVLSPAVALACPNGDSETHIIRAKPVKNVPEWAAQAEVDVPFSEDEMRSKRDGTVTLPIIRILNGDYSEKSVTFDFSNSTSCDYFGPTGSNRYIVFYIVRYAEGDPVLDDKGKKLVNMIPFNWSLDPNYEGLSLPAPWDFSDIKSEREIASCMRRGKETPQAIDKCVESKDPSKLFQKWPFPYLAIAIIIALLMATFTAFRWYRQNKNV